MSSMTLFLILILAMAFEPITAIRSANMFSSTAKLISDSDSNENAYAPAPAPTPIQPILYELIDNSTSPGNSRFEAEIGQLYGAETLLFASEYVLSMLYRGQKPHYGKDYTVVEAIVESFSHDGIGQYPLAVASTVDNKIRLNSDYIQYYTGDVKYEFTGILYHESTHVWQWTGNGMAPAGLINGIADYVRLKAGWPSVRWGERGSGERWDEGYFVTAYFLEYCDKIKEGFVAELNGMMMKGYSDYLFLWLMGKTVDELWTEYKVAYVIPAPAPSPGC